MGLPIVLFVINGYSVTLFLSVFIFMWCTYLWETYLSIRQKRKIVDSRTVPIELSSVMDNDKFQKSRLYAIDRSNFSLISGLYHMLELSVTLYFSLIPWLWYTVINHSIILNAYIRNKLGIDIGLGQDSEIKCSIIFFLYVAIFAFFDSLPWSTYSTFVIEARHGFNKQTFGFFLKDQIKSFFISMIIGIPVMACLVWIIKVGGQYFYLYAFLFTVLVTVFLMFVYPEFIAPLFDRYEPLPDGSLKTKIETLAASIKFPLKKLLVVEGSRRSAHSNAYFYGFGKNKRIVIFDTLIRGFKFPNKNEDIATQETKDDSDQRGCAVDEEILAVIAHELGHWKLGHTIYNLFIGKANLLLLFVVFGLLMDMDDLFISFGFRINDTPTILRLFIIFQYIFSPYNTVLDFLMTVLSRKFEFQADAFAAKLGYKDYLKSALVTLLKDNLSFPVCDWLYSMFNHSHPPLLERLSAIDKCKTD
ncbi:hypothetical protein MN116_006734 [Schistosoma mekongi]|uniref:CAAX prenyl protease n=1 Tax=Schistosoma mekongi TaxID=38744 RepID=A0AAE1Z944_SCHME|nr:hypothetical protein MN116_006734 [Schistosoma mekongi]